MPLLMCLNEDEANFVLRELHKGFCGSHIIVASLTLKALRNGYFWPTMKVNALNLVKKKKCNKYYKHSHIPRKPSSKQLPLVVTWPFH